MWCFFMCPIDVPDLSKLFFLFKKKNGFRSHWSANWCRTCQELDGFGICYHRWNTSLSNAGHFSHTSINLMNLINLILPLTHNFQFNSIGTVATVKTFETAIKWAKLDASVLICCWLIQPFWLPSIVSCLTSSYLEDSSIPLGWYHRCRIQPDSMDAVEGQDPNVDSHKSRDRVTLSHMQTNPCGMRCSSVCLFTPREWHHLSLGCYYASYNRSNFVRTVTNP